MMHQAVVHGQVARFKFSTSLISGARGDFSSALEAADIRVYKNDSTTERSSTAGFTVTSGFDSMVGVHHVAIDTADDTDAGFFRPGNDYHVVAYPDETVDGLAVGAPIGSFSIDPRTSDMPYVGVLQAAGSTSSITLPTECPATADELIGCFVALLSGTGKRQAPRQITAYSSARVATLDPALVTAVDTTTYVGILLGAPAPTTTVPNVNASKVGGTTQTGGDLAALIAAVDDFLDTEMPALTTAVDALPTNAELATALAAADDAILAAIAALNNLSAAQVNAEVVDVIRTDTVAELTAPPAANAALSAKINWLFMKARNLVTQTATAQIVKADDGTTTVGTSTVSDDGTTASRGEFS